MADPIYEAYTAKKSDIGIYTDLEEIIYALMMRHTRSELNELGKTIGGRIKAALDDAYGVAPEADKKSFKDAVMQGMKK